MTESLEDHPSHSFDWSAARQRLQLAMRKFETLGTIDPTDARKILDERARALARQPEATEKDGARLTIISFTIGAENYAIEAIFVREIARLTDFLPLPGTPNFVVGAAKLRGEIHAIFDIRALSGTSPATPSPTSRIIVVGRERFEFGLIADTVHNVSMLSPSDILAPVKHNDDIGPRLYRGSTKDATLIVDGAAMLNEMNLYIGRNLDLPGEDNHEIRS